MDYDYSCCIPPPAIERMAAAPRLGARPGGLERPRDCAGAGRDPGRGEPVAEAGARRRRRSLGPSHAPGLGAAPDCRAAGAAAGACWPTAPKPMAFWATCGPAKRVAAVIKQEFGVRLPPRACQSPPAGRSAGASRSRIRGRPSATKQPSSAGPRSAGPRLSSKAQSEQRTIVWVDESAFYPFPAVVRTYAPRGETPMLDALLTHDHLSAISGLTQDGPAVAPDPGARRSAAPRSSASCGICCARSRVQLLVIWDGAPIHRAQPVRDFLAQGAAARLQLEQLPGYAPELNPDEGIWHYLKHVELRNLCCADLNDAARTGAGRQAAPPQAPRPPWLRRSVRLHRPGRAPGCLTAVRTFPWTDVEWRHGA